MRNGCSRWLCGWPPTRWRWSRGFVRLFSCSVLDLLVMARIWRCYCVAVIDDLLWCSMMPWWVKVRGDNGENSTGTQLTMVMEGVFEEKVEVIELRPWWRGCHGDFGEVSFYMFFLWNLVVFSLDFFL